jgi:hypothetical protein
MSVSSCKTEKHVMLQAVFPTDDICTSLQDIMKTGSGTHVLLTWGTDGTILNLGMGKGGPMSKPRATVAMKRLFCKDVCQGGREIEH